MPDFFSNSLLEAKFRDIAFPVTDFQISVTQDIAEHKRPDQDGALIEATGRNAIRFTASIPFFQGLARGPNENWTDLYPDRHRSFLAAMANRSAGQLQHPSFGVVTVKPVSVQSSLSADRRQGEAVQAEWVEATETQSDSTALFQQNPFAAGASASQALDTILDQRPDIKKADPDKRISLSEAFNRVVAVFDTASLLVKRGLGTINTLSYRINTLHRAVVGLADPKTWEIRDKLETLSASVTQVKNLGIGKVGQYVFYVVPATVTLGELASSLNVSVSELIDLNPFLARKVTVERAEIVRRYKRTNINQANELTAGRRRNGRPA